MVYQLSSGDGEVDLLRIVRRGLRNGASTYAITQIVEEYHNATDIENKPGPVAEIDYIQRLKDYISQNNLEGFKSTFESIEDKKNPELRRLLLTAWQEGGEAFFDYLYGALCNVLDQDPLDTFNVLDCRIVSFLPKEKLEAIKIIKDQNFQGDVRQYYNFLASSAMNPDKRVWDHFLQKRDLSQESNIYIFNILVENSCQNSSDIVGDEILQEIKNSMESVQPSKDSMLHIINSDYCAKTWKEFSNDVSDLKDKVFLKEVQLQIKNKNLELLQVVSEDTGLGITFEVILTSLLAPKNIKFEYFDKWWQENSEKLDKDQKNTLLIYASLNQSFEIIEAILSKVDEKITDSNLSSGIASILVNNETLSFDQRFALLEEFDKKVETEFQVFCTSQVKSKIEILQQDLTVEEVEQDLQDLDLLDLPERNPVVLTGSVGFRITGSETGLV